VSDLDRLQRRLGYEFKKADLLKQALTHRSANRRHNERLEFLGDSIVNFVIAEALFHKFSDQKEGVLSCLRANIVKGDALAELGRGFDLGGYLFLGPGERKSAGHKRSSILAGTVEAIIGAIYLDSDFVTVQSCILNWHKDLLEALTLKDYLLDNKTKLQECMQAQHLPLPVYEVVLIQGKAHEQEFTVNCVIADHPAPFVGKGTTRRKAEQVAAALALESLSNEK
jgi:ribonuclease-3